ncbi:cytochrome c oxidase subunit 6B1-like [Leptopilina heterotoma]|uniref:cytochrome c oxidase subunit 6B1-like n=1 Tax=Leptopilina heterotoma TaxID=63436 RepID=UPI001CA868D6|nr:cytochrome c oxidase subunit 6B1-like [Leptopilina heterotoma]
MQDPKEVLKQLKAGTYRTTAPDKRFPNQNQTRHCYQHYVDFHRCEKVKGKGNALCKKFKRDYIIMCPNSWVERFDTQIAENRFPGKI